MDLEYSISQMAANAQRIRLLAENITDQQARWKPDANSWSILEVLGHFLDEEQRDFRVRLDIALHRPDEPWPGIDPEGWVKERRYNESDPGTILGNFLSAREESLTWLKGIPSLDWEATYLAPFGSITVGDIFASWVAHDLLHMRQLVELHWAFTLTKVAPYRVNYAGTW
jgi:hypothetical protein